MRSPPLVMDRLDTSRWRLGSLFALLACNGDLGGDDGILGDGECRVDDDCEADEYCYEGFCENDDDDDECYDDECYDDYDDYDDEPECVDDEDCDEGLRCLDGYCDEPGSSLDCLQLHGLIPRGASVEVDGAVDIAFADAQVVVAHPTRLDVVGDDGVVDVVEIGADIVAVASSDVDADGDADLVVADADAGGRLVVLMRDEVGAFVQSAEIPSPGVLDVELGARDDSTPDAIVRTEAGLSRHVSLGAPSPIVDAPVTAFAVHEQVVVYGATGTWWLDLAAPEPAAVRIDPRIATTYAWVRSSDSVWVVAASFLAPQEVRFWSRPSEVRMEHNTDAHYLDVSIADVAGDGEWDVVALTSEMFIVAADDAANGGQACTWGTMIAETSRPQLELGDVEGDGIVDIAVLDGVQLVVWTPASAEAPP